MAIALITYFEGLGADTYDAVNEELGLIGPDADWPAGLVSHVAGSTDTGWCIVDVWESQAHVDRFRAERLGPAFAKVGAVPQPSVTLVRVHNTHRHG